MSGPTYSIADSTNFEKLVKWRMKSKDNKTRGGARGVVIIVVGNEHGDSSSNPGRD